MSGQQGKVSDVSARKTWDKEEYAARAKAKDDEERQIMQQKEEMIRQGKKPRTRIKEELPKPTELMKQREGPLELDKNLGKVMIVQNPGARGPGQPGFYCEICSRNHKDSAGYLDHINSRSHLRRLGQTTRVERSTIEQVRARIALLREQTKVASEAKAFDFDKRLAEIKANEDKLREQKKIDKKAAKDAARLEILKDAVGQVEENEMSKLMGFSGFGSSKK
ncbi:hypothetical protein Clacol_000652 [Clathrus columnatus]|uniref:U1-type domain-containing protein n=1 Tax=Clathrus columnatus TaxID=1419009 RepID=A0AAV5A3I7_9AGAM|nr:hypothetical protein Clacol_000652 [Clathrus columnatus]